jgi:serine/threonine protein kinase
MEERLNALPIGTEIEGFRIQAVVGAGGFGITYRAVDLLLDRVVAIKEFLPAALVARGADQRSAVPLGAAEAEQFGWGLERFRNEARTLVAFQHPNIVPVLRYFEAFGTGYLVMAFQDGRSLEDILAALGTLAEDEILAILRPLAAGLAEVHRKGFLHRDIKPGNIYIRRDGSPVLIDFGAARQALTRKGHGMTAIVTEGYAPYEQYEVDGHQGPWTDLYGLGAVLYHCIAGERPADAPKRVAARMRGEPDPMPAARELGAGRYSDGLLGAIDAALALVEHQRPADVSAFMAIVDGRAPVPAPVAPPALSDAGPVAGDAAGAGRAAGPDTLMVGAAAPAALDPDQARARLMAERRERAVPGPTRRRLVTAAGLAVALAGAGAAAMLVDWSPRPTPPKPPEPPAPPAPPPAPLDPAAIAAKSRQPPEILWQRLVRKTGQQTVRRLVVLADGTWWLVGERHDPASGEDEIWLWRVDPAGGQILAEKSVPRARLLGPNAAAALKGGGFVLAAARPKAGGGQAAWIARFDAEGAVTAEATHATGRDALPYAVALADDDSVVVAGSTIGRGAGAYDGWLLKLGADLKPVFDKTFGGFQDDSFTGAAALADGGAVAVGWTSSAGAGRDDVWAVRVDAFGRTVWERRYGGGQDDRGKQALALANGNVLVLAETPAVGAAPANDATDPPMNAWLLMLKPDGNTLWERRFGGPRGDVFDAAAALPDGGYLAAGVAESKGAGLTDGWLARLDAEGALLWDRTYGEAGEDELRAVAYLPDGGMVAVGSAQRAAGESGQAGEPAPHVWILRLGYA